MIHLEIHGDNYFDEKYTQGTSFRGVLEGFIATSPSIQVGKRESLWFRKY